MAPNKPQSCMRPRQMMIALAEARWHVEQLWNRTVEPWVNMANDAKNAACRRRQARDGQALEHLCGAGVAQELVKESFMDLAIIAERDAAGTATADDYNDANVALAGSARVLVSTRCHCLAFPSPSFIFQLRGQRRTDLDWGGVRGRRPLAPLAPYLLLWVPPDVLHKRHKTIKAASNLSSNRLLFNP